MDDDTTDFGPGNWRGQGRPPRWSGRAKRIITASVAGLVLLASGTVIGFVITGGAAASTTSPPVSTATSGPPATPSTTSSSTGTSNTGASSSPSPSASSSTGTSTCTKLVEELIQTNHLKLATRLHALCTNPLQRLALVGGEHGTVTFNRSSGPITAVFERGTVESDTGSVITVTAQDGTTWTWDLVSNTEVRQNGSAATVSTGDQVFVIGTQASGVNDARLIRVTESS